jgi:hypothetical protein
MNLQAFGISALECLQSQNLSHPENRLSLKALAIVHGRLRFPPPQFRTTSRVR